MILVTGNGALANELVKYSSLPWVGMPIISLSRREMDITNEEQVSNTIKKYMMIYIFGEIGELKRNIIINIQGVIVD